MSLIDFSQSSQSDVLRETLAKLMEQLTQALVNVTEFSSNELRAISMLQSDEYIAKLYDYYVKNKKHLKRKHSEEILSALEKVSNVISAMMSFSERSDERV